jgi:hypothetical protein
MFGSLLNQKTFGFTINSFLQNDNLCGPAGVQEYIIRLAMIRGAKVHLSETPRYTDG